MKILLNYSVKLGKYDGNDDVFEFEIESSDENLKSAYKRAIMTGTYFEDVPELQALCDQAYEEIEKQQIQKLRDEGVAIILISHRFEDIFGLADRATVFRDAHYIGTWNIEECDEKMLVKHMVGHEIGDFFPKKKTEIGEELLRVEKLSRTGYFRDVSFNLHAGEIVGLTGLVGAGRTEVVEAIFGVTKADSGEVYINGKLVPNNRSPRMMMDMNFGLLPEDRQKQGLHLRQ